ncbi:hypothetical protein KPA96_13750 [Burkholderia cenocepacia]|uniref:hypothetical protein n=1 Tax=Burkholderia cenocepacia TaxID=95486 RepID=UPI00285E5289|nr:hypothetical protein [Burkholderia cenocepacia]MCB4346819.1 hypothetical protein [Burkholderia vietnamiensis]MDR8076721.1 hypothetical protein [Burkholderia cenocepacia]
MSYRYTYTNEELDALEKDPLNLNQYENKYRFFMQYDSRDEKQENEQPKIDTKDDK